MLLSTILLQNGLVHLRLKLALFRLELRLEGLQLGWLGQHVHVQALPGRLPGKHCALSMVDRVTRDPEIVKDEYIIFTLSCC